MAYGAVFSLANFVQYKPREIIVTDPPDKFVKSAALTAWRHRWPRRLRHPDAEQGRPGKLPTQRFDRRCSSTCWRPSAAPGATRSRLWPRPRGPGRASARQRPPHRQCRTDDLRGYLGALAARGFAAATVARHLSALRQLYRFLYAEGKRADDPAAVLEGPKRGRVAAEGALDRRSGRAAQRGAQRGRRRKPAAGGAAARGAAQLPDRSGLCDGPARLRTGGAAGLGRAARSTHAGGARQRRQGAAGAAQSIGQAQRWPSIWRCAARPSARRRRNGCSPRSANRAISPGSISPAN